MRESVTGILEDDQKRQGSRTEFTEAKVLAVKVVAAAFTAH